ncbi:MAG: J domain-containing protein [Methylocystaceae bacterium]|nr:J domain-containing protein [Methylocystaceae bacterium]
MWDILGIEPTDDKKLIKKAYARQLKNTSPEIDPEGFQKLRQAYEIARGQSVFHTPDVDTSITQTKVQPISSSSERIWNEIETKLDKLKAHSFVAEWETCVSLINELPLTHNERLEKALIKKLSTPTENGFLIDDIADEILDLLDMRFLWRVHSIDLSQIATSPEVLAHFLDRFNRSPANGLHGLLSQIWYLLTDIEANQSSTEWHTLEEKLKQFSPIERAPYTDVIRKMVGDSDTDLRSAQRDEGVKALERLFAFTKPASKWKISNSNRHNDAYAAILHKLHQLENRSSPEEWKTVLEDYSHLTFDHRNKFERKLAKHLCKIGTADDRMLIWRLPMDIVDMIDEKFNWRIQDLHLQNLIDWEDKYINFLGGLNRIERPTSDDLLQELRNILSNNGKTVSKMHWARLVKKAELLPRKRRLSMGPRVFDILKASILNDHTHPLAEGINALDRLFEFTRSKRSLKFKYARQRTPETTALTELLTSLRKKTTSPLTDLGYRSIFQSKLFSVLKALTIVLLYLIGFAIFILLCFSVPGFGGLFFICYVISKIWKYVKYA